jgi:hypothetical protein
VWKIVSRLRAAVFTNLNWTLFLTVNQDMGASAPTKTHLPQIKGSQHSAALTGSHTPSRNAVPSAPESAPVQSTSANK